MTPPIETAMEPTIQAHFLRQAEVCAKMGSPFTAALCRASVATLERSTRTGRRVLDWPGDPNGDALALRLCGALHALVLSGSDAALEAAYPPAEFDAMALSGVLAEAIARNDASLAAFLDSPPQTNEIGRSAMLLPGFLWVARTTGLPLALYEIGSSAGLNLLFDRFHYTFNGSTWGDPASPVRLCPEIRDADAPLDGSLTLVSKRGSDAAPVDIADPAQRLRLRAFVWPDQAARLKRLDAAIELARSYRHDLIAQDAAAFVRESVGRRPPDAVFVLFHSIMWQYLSDATQRDIETSMEFAGRNASSASPLAWLRMEPDRAGELHAMLTLTLWPGGEARDLARCDYHGRWMEWIDGAS